MDVDANYFYVLDRQGGARYISDWDAAKYDAYAKGTYPVGVFQSWVGIKLKTADRDAIQGNINDVAENVFSERDVNDTKNKAQQENNRTSEEDSLSGYEQMLKAQQELQELQNQLEVDIALLKKESPAINEAIQSSVKILINELTHASEEIASSARNSEQARKKAIDQLTAIFNFSRRLCEILNEIGKNRINVWDDLSANDVYQQHYKDYIECIESQNDWLMSLLNSFRISNSEANEALEESQKRHRDFAKKITMIAETLSHAQKCYAFIHQKRD